MTTEEIFEAIKSDIYNHRKENKIIIPSDEGPLSMDIDKFCSQPIEGILYDLNIDEAVLSALYKTEPLKYAEMMAITYVIKYLHNKLFPNQ